MSVVIWSTCLLAAKAIDTGTNWNLRGKNINFYMRIPLIVFIVKRFHACSLLYHQPEGVFVYFSYYQLSFANDFKFCHKEGFDFPNMVDQTQFIKHHTHVQSLWFHRLGLWSSQDARLPLRNQLLPSEAAAPRRQRNQWGISSYDGVICLSAAHKKRKRKDKHGNIRLCVSVCMAHQYPNFSFRDPMMIFSTLSSVFVTRSTVELFVMTLISLSPAFWISCRIFGHGQPPPFDRLNHPTTNLGRFSSFVNIFP